MKSISKLELRFKKWLNRKLTKGIHEIAEDLNKDSSLFPELLFLAIIWCALNIEIQELS